jgi:2-aminoethylphosphonate-pyruvate transaminase
MDRDRILLTPGPLTTTLRTKLAMLKDWGSWDADFNAVTASLRAALLDIVQGHEHVVGAAGSGPSVEAAGDVRARPVLVPDNGATSARESADEGRGESCLPRITTGRRRTRAGRRFGHALV